MNSESSPRLQRLPFAHQEGFIDSFLASPHKAHLLVSDVGLGVTTTALFLVRRVSAALPDSHILILAPNRALQAHMVEILNRDGLKARLVDRFKYREMQDSGGYTEATWGESGIFVLTADFAKQEDIADSLVTTHWDLLIIDEAHSFNGSRERPVANIVASSPELRVLALAPVWAGDVPSFGLGDYAITHWNASEILHAERTSSYVPALTISILEFQRDVGSQRFYEALEELTRRLAEHGVARNHLDEFLLSSPAATEEKLRRLRNRVANGSSGILALDTDNSDELVPIEELELESEEVKQELVHSLDHCLDEFENITNDPKLNALMGELQILPNGNSQPLRVAIFTEFRSTLFYLQTYLEEAGHATYLVHGAVAPDDRLEVIKSFDQNGGILLATRAIIMAGIELPATDLLILYDRPSTVRTMQQLVGRFNRFGRAALRRLCVMQDAGGNHEGLREGLLAIMGSA